MAVRILKVDDNPRNAGNQSRRCECNLRNGIVDDIVGGLSPRHPLAIHVDALGPGDHNDVALVVLPGQPVWPLDSVESVELVRCIFPAGRRPGNEHITLCVTGAVRRKPLRAL